MDIFDGTEQIQQLTISGDLTLTTLTNGGDPRMKAFLEAMLSTLT